MHACISECVYLLKKNMHVYVCVGCEIDAFAIEIVAFARADDRGRLEFLLSTDPPPLSQSQLNTGNMDGN